jgi:hypothetical protein
VKLDLAQTGCAERARELGVVAERERRAHERLARHCDCD